MARLPRVLHKIFGSTAPAGKIGKFGSLAAGSPVTTTDLTVIQALSNYLDGWTSAVVGDNSPAIEDENAIDYLVSKQLAYLFEEGIAEYDATTTYYTGCLVNSAGSIYVSLTDNNLGNAVSSTTNWKLANQKTIQEYNLSTSFVVPAGVTSVTIEATKKATPLIRMQTGSTQASVINPYGDAYAWGLNDHGQLGVGDVTARSSATLVLGSLSFSKIVKAGATSGASNSSRFGLTQNGNIYSWGANFDGQLGLGDVTPRSSPVIVTGGLRYQDVTSGTTANQGGVWGLTLDGSIYSWGSNTHGELGVGDTTVRSAPTAVLGGLKFWKFAEGTFLNTALALNKSGAAYGWGLNADGQLGLGDLTSKSSPIAVLGGLTFKRLVYSTRSTFGLTSAGVLYAWGLNANGQLGVGNVVSRSSPVAVLGGLTFSDIFTVASSSTFGITSAGVLYAWGLNANGELGVGDVTPRSSPVAVLGGLTFAKVTGNIASKFGLTTAGALYAWGLNTNGELGVGDVTPRSSPVAVLGGLTFIDIEFNTGVCMAIATDGRIYSIGGINTNGELGDASVTARSSPVLVVGSQIAKINPTIYRRQIQVTPGQTYAITINQFSALFGQTVVADGAVDSLKVIYDT